MGGRDLRVLVADPAAAYAASATADPDGPVERVVGAVDALTDVDPDLLDVEDVGEALGVVQRQADRLAAWRARALASFDRRRPKTKAGPAPVEQLASGVLRQDRRDASRQIRTARTLSGLPATQRAFDAGRISQRHADVIADTLSDPAVAALPGAELALLEAAERFDPAVLQLRARKLRAAADQDGAARRAADRRHERFFRMSRPDPDGMVDWHGRSDQVSAEILARAVSALMAPDPTDLAQRRNPDQRRHDALVTLARLALDHDQLPDLARQRPHILLIKPHPDLAGYLEVTDRASAMVAELVHTGAVTDTTAARLACHADTTEVLVDRRGNPLHLGRTTRDPSPAQTRALIARDRRCRRCGAPASHCQAHHIRWWEHGGPTELDNLVLLCWNCHDLIHQHGWQVQLLPDNTAVFTAPHGTTHPRPPP